LQNTKTFLKVSRL